MIATLCSALVAGIASAQTEELINFEHIDRADAQDFVEPPKPKKARVPRQKNDPKYLAAARELRDRYLEEVNTTNLLASAPHAAKYDVARQLEAAPTSLNPAVPLLKAA